MDQKQAILSAVQDLASELRRTPTLAELEHKTGIKRFHVRKHFDSYTILVKAAGLPPPPVANQYGIISEKSFAKPEKRKLQYDDIESHLDTYHQKHNRNFTFPTIQLSHREEYLVASTGDLHLPWGDLPLMSYFIAICEVTQPNTILIPGDFYDMFAHATFPKSLLTFNPGEEFRVARQMAEDFIAKLRKACPRARIVLLAGNHCVRPMKRILELYPAGEVFFEQGYKAAFQFEGVETHMDPREIVEVSPGIWANHGHFMNLGDHVKKYRRNMIVGHTHRPGVFYDQGLWEANAGLSGDLEAKCFGYTPTKITGWTKSFLLVSTAGPHVIHCA